MVSDVSTSESDRSQNTPNRKTHSKITANAAALIDSGELSTTGLFGEYCHQPDLYGKKNWADTAMPCSRQLLKHSFAAFRLRYSSPRERIRQLRPGKSVFGQNLQQLGLNVFLNSFFISPCGINEISMTPEKTIPIFVFQIGGRSKSIRTRFPFQWTTNCDTLKSTGMLIRMSM